MARQRVGAQLAGVVVCLLCLLGAAGRSEEPLSDDEAVVLAQLEDLPTPGSAQPAAELPTPEPQPDPAIDDADTGPRLELSAEEEIFEQEQIAPICTTEEALRRGLWSADVEFVYLYQQPLKNNFDLAVDSSSTFTNSMTTNNFNLRWRPGTRITLERDLGRTFLNRDQSLGVTYFGLFDYYHMTALDGPGGAATITSDFITDFITALGPANSVSGEFQTQLNSVELNLYVRKRLEQDRLIMAPDGTWSRQCKPGFLTSTFAGLRFVKYDQDFILRSTRTVPGSSYETRQAVDVQNDMFGVQVGTEWIHQDCRWNWGLRFKAGALINMADQRRRDFATAEGGFTTEFEQPGSDDQLAALLESGIFFEYHLHPRVSLRAAYDVLFLHGVAEAPDTLEDFGTGLTNDIDANENGIFHGLSLGVNMRW